MTALLIGYARVSTDEQDLTAQRDALASLGVNAERVYVDHGLTATAQGCARPSRPAAKATRSWSLSGLARNCGDVFVSRHAASG
jgi:hypothetical protein